MNELKHESSPKLPSYSYLRKEGVCLLLGDEGVLLTAGEPAAPRTHAQVRLCVPLLRSLRALGSHLVFRDRFEQETLRIL